MRVHKQIGLVDKNPISCGPQTKTVNNFQLALDGKNEHLMDVWQAQEFIGR